MAGERINVSRLSPTGPALVSQPRVLLCGYFSDYPEHAVRRDGLQENVVIYCVGGRGRVQMEREWEVHPGDVCYLRAGAPHYYAADPQDPWKIYWLHYTDATDQYAQRVAARNHASPVMRVGLRSQLAQLFDQLLEALTAAWDGLSLSRCDALTQLILCEIMESGPSEPQLEQVVDYMKRHLRDEAPLDQLAARSGLSKYHFVREFKRRYGMPPKQYMNRLRILAACELLCGGHMPVGQISEQLGYATPYYFSERFKQFTGMSPSAYRRWIQPQDPS